MDEITITRVTGLLFYEENDIRKSWYELKIPGFSPIILLVQTMRAARCKAKKVLRKMGFA